MDCRLVVENAGKFPSIVRDNFQREHVRVNVSERACQSEYVRECQSQVVKEYMSESLSESVRVRVSKSTCQRSCQRVCQRVCQQVSELDSQRLCAGVSVCQSR